MFSIGLRGNTGINHHNLSYGITFNHEKIHDRAREWELRDSAGYSLPSTGEAVKMIYNLDLSRMHTGWLHLPDILLLMPDYV